MSKNIEAEYDGSVFIPIGQVDLKKHVRYRLIIEEEPDSPNTLSAWDVLREHIGTIDGPEDWSENLDHHLYGSPKRTEEEDKDEITDSSFDHHDSYPGDIGIQFEPRK